MGWFFVWRAWLKWQTSLGWKLIRRKKINWSKEVQELIRVVNKGLDQAGYPRR